MGVATEPVTFPRFVGLRRLFIARNRTRASIWTILRDLVFSVVLISGVAIAWGERRVFILSGAEGRDIRGWPTGPP